MIVVTQYIVYRLLASGVERVSFEDVARITAALRDVGIAHVHSFEHLRDEYMLVAQALARTCNARFEDGVLYSNSLCASYSRTVLDVYDTLKDTIPDLIKLYISYIDIILKK